LAELVGDRHNRLIFLGILLAIIGLELSYGRCVQDDTFISLRYAQNLVDGHGLVYNIGERVEGYTNFLWTLGMAPILWLGIDPVMAATATGILWTVVLLAVVFVAGGGRWLAPLLVALYPGLGLEAVQGLESVFFATLVTLAWTRPRHMAIFAGLAALTRPEGFAIFGLLWLATVRTRPDRWRQAGLFAAFTVPHLLFRMAYYGDIVPNTFHAKVGGSPYLRGLAYIGTIGEWVLPVIFALCAAHVLARRGGRGREGGLPTLHLGWVLLGFYLVYMVLVGGDFKGTGRFLLPVMPVLALWAQDLAWRWRVPLGAMMLLWTLPFFQSMARHADFFAQDLVVRQEIGTFLGTTLPPDTLVAVQAAGIVPFYSKLPTLDMLGLTDTHIAQAKVATMGAGQAGHERRDYAYVLSREPDLLIPEGLLFTEERIRMGDPGIFGPDFVERYEPISIRLLGGHFNLWRKRKSG